MKKVSHSGSAACGKRNGGRSGASEPIHTHTWSSCSATGKERIVFVCGSFSPSQSAGSFSSRPLPLKHQPWYGHSTLSPTTRPSLSAMPRWAQRSTSAYGSPLEFRKRTSVSPSTSKRRGFCFNSPDGQAMYQ